jgi:uncharacterized protein HemY
MPEIYKVIRIKENGNQTTKTFNSMEDIVSSLNKEIVIKNSKLFIETEIKRLKQLLKNTQLEDTWEDENEEILCSVHVDVSMNEDKEIEIITTTTPVLIALTADDIADLDDNDYFSLDYENPVIDVMQSDDEDDEPILTKMKIVKKVTK